MEAVRQPIVEINIAGRNVTQNVTPFLLSLTYKDNVEAESDSLNIVFSDESGLWREDWFPSEGDSVSVKLGYEGALLDCGTFEIDQIELSGKPDTMIVSALAAGITKELRTKNSKAFEKQTLRKIAQYFATKHGLELVDDSNELQNIEIERKTQDNITDLAFLSKLSAEYGFIFAIHGNKMVFTTYYLLDKGDSVKTVDKTNVSHYKITDKTAHTYEKATISRRDVRTNSVQTGSAQWRVVSSGDATRRDTLVVGGRVENSQQAQARTEGALQRLNKDKTTGSFEVEGDTKLCAGVNIEFTGIGKLSGKFSVVSSTHTVSIANGYITEVDIRKTGNVPPIERTPKSEKNVSTNWANLLRPRTTR